MSFKASRIIVSVFKPKKSILITPASSITLPSYCVTSRSESFATATGIMSVKSFGAMIIPAACIPVPRTEPSSTMASFNTLPASVFVAAKYLRSSFTPSSSSPLRPSLSFKLLSPSIGAVKTRRSDMPGLSGTNFANTLASCKGKSNTRATSLILILAAMVP